MLIEFTIENFRSIKEEVTLSLVASSDKSLDNNLIKADVLNRDNLLRSAVLYGANASGKSNVLLAFDFLAFLVTKSHHFQKGGKIDISPFKLDEGYLSKPSKFEVVFIKNNIRYTYGVSINSEKIIDEYLYYYPKGRKAIIFERKDTTDYKFTMDGNKQKGFSEQTLDNTLYLSRSTQLGYNKTSEAFDWFKDNLHVIGPPDHLALTDFTVNLLKDEKEIILKAIILSDFGIDDVSAIIKEFTVDNFPVDLPIELKNLLMRDGSKGTQVKIQTFHKGIPFEFKEESEGTQRIFSLIGPWIDALKNGRVLIVDELDTKLHHLLNVFLIDLFNDPTQNKNNAQLIFSTHNTNLLDQDLFRRDQIWFTEKNPDLGSTDLYSLVEFSPRKDKDIKKGYLAGRYGALPFIKENRIF